MDMRIRTGQAFRPQGAAVAGPHHAAAGGFRVPGQQPGAAAMAVGAAAVAGLVGSVASPRDQLARRRGGALLRGVDSLQRELLAGISNPSVMQQLVGLLEGEDGEDPALAEAMRGLALRARIELARRGINRD